MPTTHPLDLTGAASTNAILNEVHTFAIAADRVFPLTAGPFFTIGLTVRHGVTNQLLQPVTQYKALQLHRAASLISGKEVCAVIIVEDATIPSVRVSYQCIGGVYSDEATLIQDLITNNPLPPGPVVWGQIIGVPVQFPPTEHLHHFDNIYGAEEIVAVLERLRIAIAAGDSPAIAAIYQYIHTLLTNLNYQTEQQVIDLIGDTAVQFIKTYDSYAALRAETNVINDESYLYIATGKATRMDRMGQIFMWDITSTLPDDNDFVLRPDHILTTDPGRFVAVLMIERKMKLLAASVGRGFDTAGVLQDNLSIVSRVYSQDLNTLMIPGPWFFTNDTLNKPPYVREGFITVSRAFGLVHQTIETTYMDLDTTSSVEHAPRTVKFTRHATEAVLGSGNFTWSEWNNSMDLVDMRRHGISTAISTYNTLPADTDADTVHYPGKYWLTTSQPNRAFDYGILEVELVGGTIGSPAEVHQRQYWGNREASRSRNFLGTWTPWTFVKARDLGYDRNLNTSGTDLNSVTEPDNYFYGPGCANTPSITGILHVRRENASVVYQEAHSDTNIIYIRRRSLFSGWSPWSTPLTQATLTIHPNPATTTVYPGSYNTVTLQPYGTIKVWMVSGGGGGASAESIEEAVGTDETQQHGGMSGVYLMVGNVVNILAICTGGLAGTSPRSNYEESPTLAGGANGANGVYYTQTYGTIDVFEAGVAPIPSGMIGNKFPSSFAGGYGVGTSKLAQGENFHGGGGGGNGAYASILIKNNSTTQSIILRLYSGAGGVNDNERGGHAGDGRLEYAIS